MAKTINQRIAMQGGDKIKDDLKKLGSAGEKAFEQIQKAAKASDGPFARFGKAAQALKKDLEQVRKAGQNVRDELGRLGGALGTLGNASATAAKRVGLITGAMAGVAAGVTALVASSGEAAREITNLSTLANATPEAFQRFAFAARTVGIEQDKLADILKDTNDKVGDFLATGGGPLKDFFEQIAPKVGVTAQQFAKLSGPEALQLYVSSLERANLNQAEMTFYLEALASDATALLPLLRNNGAALRSLGDDAERFGAVMSQGAVRSLTDAQSSLRETGSAFLALKRNIAAVFAPFVTATSDVLANFLSENNRRVTDLARDFALTLVPVVHDLLNLLSGNPDAVQTLWIIQAREAVLTFADTVQRAINGILLPAYRTLINGADLVARQVNRIFGTDFDGKTLLVAGAITKLVGGFGLLSAAVGVAAASFRTLLAALRLGGAAIAFVGVQLGKLSVVSGIVGGISSTFAGLFTAIRLGAARMLGLVVADVGKAALAVSRGFGVLVSGLGVAVRAGLVVLAPLLGWPALLGAAVGTAAALIYTYWDDIAAGAQRLWARLGPIFGAGVDAVAGAASAAAARVVEAYEARRARFVAFWDAIIVAGRNAADGIARAWQFAMPIIEAVWEIVVDRAQRAWDEVSRLFGDGFEVLWDGIKAGAKLVWEFIEDGFRALGNSIVSIFDGVVSRIQSIANRIKSLASSVKSAASGLFGGGDSGPPEKTFSTGGQVRGPGTATSDSIPARLSDGEFVQRTKAVKYYGVGLMDSLNRMRIKRDDLFRALRQVRAPVRQFAQGGLVRSIERIREPVQRFAHGGLVRHQIAMPSFDPAAMFGAMTTGIMPAQRFAQGGLVQSAAPGGGRAVTIQLPGGETVEGFTATDDAIDRMQRIAARGKVVSAGRRPGWYGGGK